MFDNRMPPARKTPAGWAVARRGKLTLALATLALLAACSQTQAVYPDKRDPTQASPTWGDQPQPGLFGPGGLTLFGGADRKKDEQGGGAGIGVNAYLWRASLDTISFMPLSSADPFGGVILTEWYATPESPKERFKMTVIIQDRSLRADGIRVSVFRQTQSASGEWVDAAVESHTAGNLEDAILTRARELRSAAAAAAAAKTN
jgi:hypothetical protein